MDRSCTFKLNVAVGMAFSALSTVLRESLIEDAARTAALPGPIAGSTGAADAIL